MKHQGKFTFLGYQQLILFIGIGVILWAAILLQLLAHDTPCPRCWEARGVYLIILELLMLSVILGYCELLTIVLIFLFIVLGNYITVQQLITHTIKLTEALAHRPGYGAYADFLTISLPMWNMIIANASIIYIALMNFFRHKFNVEQYKTRSLKSIALALIWGLAPLIVNLILFTQHLENSGKFQ